MEKRHKKALTLLLFQIMLFLFYLSARRLGRRVLIQVVQSTRCIPTNCQGAAEQRKSCSYKLGLLHCSAQKIKKEINSQIFEIVLDCTIRQLNLFQMKNQSIAAQRTYQCVLVQGLQAELVGDFSVSRAELQEDPVVCHHEKHSIMDLYYFNNGLL